MKKIVSILLVLALMATLFAAVTACTKRENVLKLYMPGEYIDEDLSRMSISPAMWSKSPNRTLIRPRTSKWC